MNAYEYPEQYGPRSPSFARATLCESSGGSQLFLSGTASVVGHESRHHGFPELQTQETIENIRTLLAHAEGPSHSTNGNRPWDSCYKVYVRHLEQLPVIQRTLHTSPLASSQILYLQGNLCRRELLVEVEGFITRS